MFRAMLRAEATLLVGLAAIPLTLTLAARSWSDRPVPPPLDLPDPAQAAGGFAAAAAVLGGTDDGGPPYGTPSHARFDTLPVDDPFIRDPRARSAPNSGSVDPTPVPTFALTGIMRLRSRPIAMVDGVPCRVGDLVGGGGWRVASIDISRRLVRFIGNDGREVTVSLAPDG